MTHLRLVPLLLTLWAVSCADNKEQKSITIKPTALKIPTINNTIAAKNVTANSKMGSNPDGAMITRALFVLIGITAIGFLYFLVRAVRLKKTGVQRKKYGLLSNYDDTMEMAHLESDEDDTTVYEAKSLRR